MRDFIKINKIPFLGWRIGVAFLIVFTLTITFISGLIEISGANGWLELHSRYPLTYAIDILPVLFYCLVYFIASNRYNDDIASIYLDEKEKSINKIALALGKIEDGTYDSKSNITGEAKVDEAISKIRTKFDEESSLEEKRNWTNEGLAKFRETLSAHSEIQPLCDEIISKLTKYVDASQGGVFIFNEEDKKLELISSYAYEQKRLENKKISIGEGLIGQCYLERDTIFLTDIPDDYLAIGSGLGEGCPRCIIIIPLKLKDEMVGVIELASFRPFEANKVDFIERLSESLAQSITTIRVNEHTRFLLDESIAREQQMMEQEERMRESMEELYVTQEEMGKVNLEMEEVFKALDTLAATFELNPAGEIIKLNHNFAQFLGYEPKELLGKKFIYLIDRNQHDENELNTFWTSLLNGEAQQVVFTHFDKDAAHKWLRSGFYPLRNTYGQIERILGFANDITEIKTKELRLNELNHEMAATKVMLIKILNEIPLKVFLKQYNGKFFVANDAVSKFHDLPSAEDLIGKSDFDFYDEKEAAEWLKAEHEIIASGRREYLNEDSGKVLSTVKMPFFIDPIGEKGLLGIQADITEVANLRRKAMELQKQVDDLKKASENNKEIKV